MRDAKEEFLSQKSIAVVGVSRSRGFGNMAFRELKKRGYRVYPVNQNAVTVEGEQAYRNLDELPESVDGVLTVVPPDQTERVVADCVRLGIGQVWMQQGSESEEAIRACEEGGVSAVHGACILMYADPASFHRVHRWVWGLLGKL